MHFKEVKTPLNYTKIEKEILKFWEDNNIFQRSIEERSENNSFVFYEGPPTANGRPGIHHVISRTIKDFVCRFKTMKGYRVERKAGWDTHGLPVEIEIEKELGFETKDQIEAYGVDKFNKKCRDSVFKYLQEWNELTRRMAYWVDLKQPYITYEDNYIETVWWLLAQLWKKNLLYQGFKILPYCPRCETALSSHEVSLGYKDVTERAVTLKFKLRDGENRFILAWTTTPWTLPGNVALAVGPDITYVEIEQEFNGKKEHYFLAEDRLEIIKGEFQVIRKLPGKEITGWEYEPLFDFIDLSDDEHKAYYVAEADFVTTDEGTGVVHTAVMYGEDDYRLGLKIGLPARHTVDQHGKFNELVKKWQGRPVKDFDTETEIISYLFENNRLYAKEKYTHSYPHCWRCDSPILYYAKKSWYVKTTELKSKLIENNKKINWFPKEVGSGRFGTWLENNVDWAISRSRYWGTPLNIWICEECDNRIAVDSIDMLKELSGADKIEDLHKPNIDNLNVKCPKCGEHMTRTPEVIDCWFDSGAMPYAQIHYPFEGEEPFKNGFPADFIAEGVDQTRGWFYSLLAISTLISGVPSYKNCLSVEMILDKDGQKMSKSKGNTVNPFEIFDVEGADALRWYLFTVSPPWVPTKFDREGVKEVLRKFLGTLANTYSFFVMYANIDNFKPGEYNIPVDKRPEIDRWLISARNSLVKNVNKLLERYDVTKAARAIQEFAIDDLSNWYVRRNRRRFWKSEKGDDKFAAFETLYETLLTVSQLSAPFIPFLSEEIYRNLSTEITSSADSVHLSSFPDNEDEQFKYIDKDLEDRMDIARRLVAMCRSARNDAKIKVRQPLDKVYINIQGEKRKKSALLLKGLILEEINVKDFDLVGDTKLFLIKKAVPVFSRLGPVFGKDVNSAAEAIRNLSEKEVEELSENGKLMIRVKENDIEINIGMVEIELQPKEGFAIQRDGDITIALDTHISDELKTEGFAREFVNRVQNMRKEADYNVTDRIEVYYKPEDGVDKLIEKMKDYIAKEVLAIFIKPELIDADLIKELALDNLKVTVGIKRAESKFN
ncbi:isoleucine--tRNA ligase [bacterium]|nr:isoleucine--tRNA ligase [bacterium]